MSTKIYNAYQFLGTSEELMVILKELKKDYYEYLKTFLKNLHYSNHVFEKKRYPFLEQDLTFKELKQKDFADYLLEDIIHKEIKIGDWHPLNIDSSAVVYFFENKIFIQFFGLPKEFRSFIDKNNKFKDYHYQNSTDMSNYNWDDEDWNTMTEERQTELESEWNERRKIWNEIMPDYSVPSECGLTFEFTPMGYKFNQLCNFILESN